MSLIHIRNFLAPFQNKLHIGAIIVVVFLVAVIRLSSHSSDNDPARGRGSALENGGDVNDAIAGFLSDPEGEADPRAGYKKANSPTVRAQPRGDDFLNELMQEETHAKKPTAAKEPVPGGGLSDIKKSLGLE